MTYEPDAGPPGHSVAIIGMSGRFPGAAGVDELWADLLAGKEAVTRYTREELAEAGVPERLLDDPAYVPAGRPVEGFDLFDAEFFGVPRTEAELMDPQHRLLLETAWHALERAGYPPRESGARTGVFVGVSSSTYLLERVAGAGSAEVSDELQRAIGNDPGMPALRVSYKLGLTGPSFTVLSACSSSLVAVHLAVQSLLARESDLALAGGAAVRELEPRGYRYEEGAILSADGHCRPFDASASGTVSGDGVGLVVLKRLEDALADGDHIHAVIRGTAVNNDGSAKVGFTAPSPEGQAEVIAEALAVAGVDPATIQYVEAHGTATPLGDPIEVRALTEAFGPDVPAGSCLLGSVKANIGHLDAAAGVAGLIKTALALEHRFVPPAPHFRTPNPELGLEKTPFRVNAEGIPWPEAAHPPRAGVSAFGVGGTNAHVVLEAAPPVTPPRDVPRRSWHILPVSARTAPAAEDAAALLARELRDGGPALADVAYTLQVGRTAFAHRRAVVCRDRAGAVAALEPSGGAVPPPPDHHETPPPVVFMFPGQGSQHPGMGARLYRTEPVFREAMDECAELLRPHLGRDVREVAFGDGADARERLRDTLHTQPAVFSVGHALARLLMSWGVRPSAMIGHSLGEYVAACLAGVFTLEDAARLVAARARLMHDLPPGRMLSVPLEESAAREALGGLAQVAAVNAPAACVVAGGPEEIAEARRVLEGRGVAVRELETSHAFHTSLVEPALPGLAEVFRSVRLGAPRIPFVSNVTGTWITAGQATDPEYWVSHTRRPVRFSDGLATLAGQGADAVLVETGPGSALAGLARAHRAHQADQPHQARDAHRAGAGARGTTVTLMPRPGGEAAEDRAVLEGLAALWRRGVSVDWRAFHGDEPRRRVPLPGYSFQRRRHLLPRPGAAASGAGSSRRAPSRWTYAPVWHPSAPPKPGEPAAHQAGEPAAWLVLADEAGLAGRLTEVLRGRGHAVTTVRMGRDYARLAEDVFRADPARPEHLSRVLRELRGDGFVPARVLHAWSVAGPASATARDHTPGDRAGDRGRAEDVVRRYQESQERGFHSMVALVQALGENGDDRPVRVDVLTDDLHDVAGSPVRLPERATVYGAVTVLPQEYAALTCGAVDVTVPADDAGLRALAERLAAELTGPRGDALVAYRGGRRWRRAFAPVELGPVPAGTVWRRDGGYLVTGASGETGLAFAEHLAASGARLVMVGDQGFPARDTWDDGATDARTRAGIARLSALVSGDAVTYLDADLSDPAEAARAVAEARSRLGRIRGVFHMPGARGSGMVALKTRDRFEPVLANRVRSTLLLGELLDGEDLDFLLLDSSTTGVVGGFGQADNCAAAAFLDAFAQAGAARGRHMVAVDWGQWEWDDWLEEQMAGLPEVREQYERLRREQGIPAADGLAVARSVLASGLPQVVVSTVDFQDVLADGSRLTATAFTDSLGSHGAGRGPDTGWDPADTWPGDEVAQNVASVWRDLLGVPSIGPEEDFYALGGNSLFAIQIVSRLRQVYGDIPMSAVFEAPTVPGLAAAIRAHQAESIGLDEFEALLREVESLSLEEAEAKLKGDHV
ncbi:acyltransferase domain-containing protein [Sphaerisporangium album]|uniref:Acyltransferase domain-containing protein n=1 Tax=Sphaerisporangium album TaxID=509200 RepID=A0A367F9E9_9ACTN|nr:type I polyketide synthase [Sphaerisporangium album]RCG26200.1 acyltransferase domain-containing protein [Sphaerisporangium album]